jgi:hypothetical protein
LSCDKAKKSPAIPDMGFYLSCIAVGQGIISISGTAEKSQKMVIRNNKNESITSSVQ